MLTFPSIERIFLDRSRHDGCHLERQDQEKCRHSGCHYRHSGCAPYRHKRCNAAAKSWRNVRADARSPLRRMQESRHSGCSENELLGQRCRTQKGFARIARPTNLFLILFNRCGTNAKAVLGGNWRQHVKSKVIAEVGSARVNVIGCKPMNIDVIGCKRMNIDVNECKNIVPNTSLLKLSHKFWNSRHHARTEEANRGFSDFFFFRRSIGASRGVKGEPLAHTIWLRQIVSWVIHADHHSPKPPCYCGKES